MIEILALLWSMNLSADARHHAIAKPASAALASGQQSRQSVIFERPALARTDATGAVELWDGRAHVGATNRLSLSRLAYPRGDAEIRLTYDDATNTLAPQCEVTSSRGSRMNGSDVAGLADLERLVRERFRTDSTAEVSVVGEHVVVTWAARRESTARLGMDSGYVWTREGRIIEVEDGVVYTYQKRCSARSSSADVGRGELDAAWESLRVTVG